MDWTKLDDTRSKNLKSTCRVVFAWAASNSKQINDGYSLIARGDTRCKETLLFLALTSVQTKIGAKRSHARSCEGVDAMRKMGEARWRMLPCMLTPIWARHAARALDGMRWRRQSQSTLKSRETKAVRPSLHNKQGTCQATVHGSLIWFSEH